MKIGSTVLVCVRECACERGKIKRKFRLSGQALKAN